MKEIVSESDRAAIYEATFKAYCATCSSDFAYRKGASVGDSLGVEPLRSDEIARDAVDDVCASQREYNKELLENADGFVRRYLKKFRESEEEKESQE